MIVLRRGLFDFYFLKLCVGRAFKNRWSNLMMQKYDNIVWSLAAAAFLVLSFMGTAQAKYCKIDHYHYGAGSEQSSLQKAKADAANAWSSFTSWEYGAQWGNIRMAMSRSYNCSRSGIGYKCSVSAKPCRADRGRSLRTVRKYRSRRTVRRRGMKRYGARKHARTRNKWTYHW